MYIHVKAYPGQKREEVKKISFDHFEIRVKEAAKDNLANRRIVEIIKSFNPGAIVRIINGHHSPSKLISINED